jgi:anti-sigma B factor antagonist
MTMSVTVTVKIDGAADVSVRGEIDHTNAITLRDELLSLAANRRPKIIRVDLGLVTFLDSAAVGALVAAQRGAAAEGVHLVVVHASPFVERQLGIAGVGELLGLPYAPGGDYLPR